MLDDERLDIVITAEQQQRDTESAWAVVAAPVLNDGRLDIAITTEHQRDELHFSVPDGFRTHPDLVAAAMAPLLAARHSRISFEFPVSDIVREQVEMRTGASVTAAGTGERRQPGRRIALNFSGGMDSLAAWLLAPDQVERVAIDFGGSFGREREFFETLDPEVTCVTNFRSKGYAADDWMFMGSAAMLFADHLDLGWMGYGTNFESSTWNYRHRGWTPDADGPSQFLDTIGLRDCTLTRGMSEFCGSLVVDHYASALVEESLRSIAAPGSEKRFRKRLAYDSAVAFRGGPPVDLDTRELPTKKVKMWQSYPVDVAMLAFMAMYPPDVVGRFVDELEPELVQAVQDVRPDFMFRCNPLFADQVPIALRDTVRQRMADAGVEMYRDDDWPEYEKLRSILARHYTLPN